MKKKDFITLSIKHDWWYPVCPGHLYGTAAGRGCADLGYHIGAAGAAGPSGHGAGRWHEHDDDLGQVGPRCHCGHRGNCAAASEPRNQRLAVICGGDTGEGLRTPRLCFAVFDVFRAPKPHEGTWMVVKTNRETQN